MTSVSAKTVFWDGLEVDFTRFVTVTSVASGSGCFGEGCGEGGAGEFVVAGGAVEFTAALEVEVADAVGGEVALTGVEAGAGAAA
jgi:hypothetical protein